MLAAPAAGLPTRSAKPTHRAHLTHERNLPGMAVQAKELGVTGYPWQPDGPRAGTWLPGRPSCVQVREVRERELDQSGRRPCNEQTEPPGTDAAPLRHRPAGNS
ncbi:MAG: hypothetical protein OXP69_00910 [Spirochaetaceae bacterium]|nr:hypothetical protein [Spirochaetaceae bacterium]